MSGLSNLRPSVKQLGHMIPRLAAMHIRGFRVEPAHVDWSWNDNRKAATAQSLDKNNRKLSPTWDILISDRRRTEAGQVEALPCPVMCILAAAAMLSLSGR